MTVAEAILDLPKLVPNQNQKERAKFSHLPKSTDTLNHKPRFHSERDIRIFQELALDGMRRERKYKNRRS